ncbi:hypothetical protein HMJ29_12735 [Hymenobacter taeanensis]|uniref:Lipocalin family protein n=1 Tax=Hymenobacter taeanensis TaxID=2735321 RepID=A0A6M6BIB8_9BACT|nr:MULTISPECIES: hypothetical protein [Hymenobacter]QJX47760.1 hypothetical protein HMJ29_12735 [Hymenobacter taeanensis]UOQ82754.1 hypothetical protein MUN83_08335 [Hymenobacter sp. 5414T-23]
MLRTRTTSLLLLLLTLVAGLTSSCGIFEEPLCGCIPPPLPTFTSAQLTQTNTWWLQQVTSGSQTVKGADIKDRYSMSFRPDGTYTQTLLSDDTDNQGTWMLMGTRNSDLHLVDHKGDNQSYTLEGANPEVLYYSRMNKSGQPEVYMFTAKP